MNQKQLADLNEVVARQPAGEARFVALTNGIIAHLSNAKANIANGQAQAALQDVIDLLESNKDGMAAAVTGGGSFAPTAPAAMPIATEAHPGEVQPTGRAPIYTGPDTVTRLEPHPDDANPALMGDVPEPRMVPREVPVGERVLINGEPTTRSLDGERLDNPGLTGASQGAAPTASAALDWPPAESAIGVENGTERRGSTGQLFTAIDGVWHRTAEHDAATAQPEQKPDNSNAAGGSAGDTKPDGTPKTVDGTAIPPQAPQPAPQPAP